jgi:nitrate/nitrite transport system ATP-binding protein
LDALTRGTLQKEIDKIWSSDKKTVVLITNDVDEALMLADRVIPLNPGPKATLGPSFKVDLDRPRDKTALNSDDKFKELRNGLIKYLSEARTKSRAESIPPPGNEPEDGDMVPNLEPIDFLPARA